MPVQKNIQPNSFAVRMNSDAADELLQPGEYREAHNIRSRSGVATNIKGNTLIPYTYPGSEDAEIKTIGKYADAANNRLLYFVWHSEGLHHILEYDLELSTITPIFISKTNSDGIDILKFDKDHLITGVELVSGTDLLIWCDGLNPIRCMNIREARERVNDWTEEQINLHKRAPSMAPELFYSSDPTRENNYLFGNLIKAAYRYIYKDGLISTFSDFSKVPLPINESYRGENGVSSANNLVKIRVGTGDETVEKIEIAVQVGDRDFVSVKILDKEQEELLDNETYDLNFYNDGNYSVIPKDDVIQPYNYLPKNPAALALINGKILTVAGGEEGWDDVAIEAESTVEYEEVDFTGTTSTVVDVPTFRVITGLSKFDRPQPAYRSTQTFLIGPDVAEGFTYFVRGLNHSFNWNYAATTTDTPISVLTKFRNVYLGASKYATATAITTDADGNAFFTGVWRDRDKYRDFTAGANGQAATINITGTNKTIKANKSGSVVQYGIQYEDAEGRKSPTFTSDELVVKSKFLNEHTQTGNAKIKVPIHILSISHTPPKDAVRFQLMRSRNLTYKNFVQTLCLDAFQVENADTGEIYLDLVIDGFDSYNRLYPNSIVGYQFTPGDRIRFIRGKDSQTTNTVYDFHEAVILEQRWNAVKKVDGNVATTSGSAQITMDTGTADEINIGKKIKLSGEGNITFERTIIGVADTNNKYTLDQAINVTATYVSFELIDIRNIIRIKNPLAVIEPLSMIEIFTPALGETNAGGGQLFFEFGEKYEINNPGEDNRTHEGAMQTQTDVLPAIFKIKDGDVFIRNREVPTNFPVLPEHIQTYVEVVEDENFSDFYKSAVNDNGRPSTTFTGTEVKTFGSRIRFGGQNLLNTETNRINMFRSTDREDYEDNYGDIKLLKYKEERLLCFKEKIFGFIPVLQNIVRTMDGDSLLSASSKLLNPIQYFAFNGGIGDATDSYTEGENQWYASCPEAGTWVRFGGDGFTPISQTSLFHNASKEHFDAVRLRQAMIHTGYDRRNQEAIFAIENAPPKVFANSFSPSSWATVPTATIDPTTYEIVTEPTLGTVTLGEDGVATYNATPGETGSDFFTFRVKDTDGIGLPVTKVCLDVIEAVIFDFIDQEGLEPSTLTLSNITPVTGIYDDYVIEVADGIEYRVNGGDWVSGMATILLENDTVQLRRTSSANYGEALTTSVTISGVTKTWNITTKPPLLAWRAKDSTGYCIARDADTTPDQFTFVDISGAEISTQYTSNAITVNNVEAPADISVVGGEYEVNTSGDWLTAAGTVNNGDTVKVRRTSSSSFLTGAGVTLTIGGVSDIYMITTRAADSTPGVFVFTDRTGADLNTIYSSNTVTILGIDAGTAISITGGEYRIDGGSWVTAAGTINANQTVQVRRASSGSYLTAANATLTVGTYSDTYTITTKAELTPQPFFFIDQTGVNINTYAVSNTVTLEGLSSPAPLWITGGEYSINGGPWSSSQGDPVADVPPPTTTTTVQNLVGYATLGNGTTGGGNATPVTVSTFTALKNALASTFPQVVKISGTINMTGIIYLQSNKTVIGLEGAKITGAGGFNIDSKSNIIIQNIDFDTVTTGDCITIRDNSHHIWVDHCRLTGGQDGLLDITNASDFVTLSWCKFIGASRCVLIGGGYPNTEDIGKLNITIHHCWFLDNFERGPSIRYGKVHYFNNFTSRTTATFSYGVGVREEATALIEYNSWKNLNQGRPIDSFHQPTGKIAGTTTDFYDSTSAGRNRIEYGLDNSYVPPYTYTFDRAADIEALVTAGAGPTLGNNATGLPSTTTTSSSPAEEEEVVITTPTIVGYGAGVTGGAAGPTVTVSTFAELKAEAESSGAKVIKVSGTITGDGSTSNIAITSDKSILGAFGTIISGVGFFAITGKNNIIIQNLQFQDYVLNDNLDSIRITSSTNIWIDHCYFKATKGDAAIDLYGGSDLVTISNCKFENCDRTLRLGTSTSGDVDAGKIRVTVYKNHFLNCIQRTPQVYYGHVHVLNNFYQYNVTTNQNECVNVATSATVKIENNYFHGINDTILLVQAGATGYQETGSVRVQCGAVDSIAAGKATTITMPYSYTAETAEAAQTSIVASGGAGATMTNPTGAAPSGPTTPAAAMVEDGDTVAVRVLTSSVYDKDHDVTLTIGSSPALSDTFTARTKIADRTPAAFSFTAQTDKELSTSYESNTVTITSIDPATEISITGGEYKVGNGGWLSIPSTINNNETLTLRRTSSSSYSTSVSTTVTVGTASATFTIGTRAANSTPDSWCFTTNVTNAELNTTYESEVRTITGIDPGTTISNNNGHYRINGGNWTNSPGTIGPNSTVQVRRPSAGSYNSTLSVTLTIGTSSCVWSVTTKVQTDTTPAAYNWDDVTGAELSTIYISNAQVITGINAPAPITITNGGEYSINTSGTTGTWGAWTSAAGTVNNGQGVRVRRTSSVSYSTTISVVTSIGGVTSTYSIATKAQPPAPVVGVAHSVTIPQTTSTGACAAPKTQTYYTQPTDIYPTVGMVFYTNSSLTTVYNSPSQSSSTSTWHGVLWNGSTSNGANLSINLNVGVVTSVSECVVIPPDTTPDDFTLVRKDNVELNTFYASNSFQVTGINAAAAISISGNSGMYATSSDGITWGAYTGSAGTVTNNTYVRVRLSSANAYLTELSTTLNIGGKTAVYYVKTKAEPAPPPPVGVAHTLTTPSAANDVCFAPRIQTRYTNPTNLAPTVGMQFYNDSTLTTPFGGDNWHGVTWGGPNNVGTKYAVQLTDGLVTAFAACPDPDTTPAAYSYTPVTNAELNTAYTSNEITVAGINTTTSISVTNGTYSKNGGAFTSVAGTVISGDKIQVRVTSSANTITLVSASTNIGGVVAAFNVTTKADTVPLAYSYTPRTNAALDTAYESNEVTITGINGPTPISVTNGTYSINGGTFTSVAGTVNNNAKVKIRVLSSSSYSTTVSGSTSIGGVVGTFLVTTLDDTTPVNYSYTPRNNAELSTAYDSNEITVTGITGPTTITVSNGSYSKNSGAFTTAAGTVVANDKIKIRVTSSASYATAVSGSTTIGGVTGTFVVTTKNDTVPDAFSFTPVTNAELNTDYTSNSITVTGITSGAASAISITGGSYAKNGAATFVTTAGTVRLNDTVVVKGTSSGSYSTATGPTLSIGGVTAQFSITTKVAPPVGVAHNFSIPQESETAACNAPKNQTRYTFPSNLAPTVGMQFYTDANCTVPFTANGWHGIIWGGTNNVGVWYAVFLTSGVVSQPPYTCPGLQ